MTYWNFILPYLKNKNKTSILKGSDDGVLCSGVLSANILQEHDVLECGTDPYSDEWFLFSWVS